MNKHGITNVFAYAAANEQMFEDNYNDMGHKRLTTFFSDLSIAEWYGIPSVKDTFNNVMKHWSKDTKYFTEFVICLNHKIWQHYEDDEPLARVYNELWEKASAYVEANWKGDDLSYYYQMTD